jgi:branched-chain amino acid transport system substrate-binding protein
MRMALGTTKRKSWLSLFGKPETLQRLVVVVVNILTLFITAGVAQNLVIGFTVSRTGDLNVDSLEQYRGFELWRDEVNADGGIRAGGKAYKVQFISYDDESNTSRVEQLYSRMILQDHADFLFSPYSSNLTGTAAVVTEQHGKIMLTTGAAEGSTYKQGNHYLFQMFSPATEYLKGVLDALKTRDPKAELAFVYEDSTFSLSVVNSAKSYAHQLGLNVALSEAYAPGTTDFGAIVDKVVASKSTVLLGGGHFADGSMVAKQMYSHKVPLKMVALLVAPDSSLWGERGDAAVGVIVPSQWERQTSFKTQYGLSATDFAETYTTKYNVPPSYESAGGYACGLILQHAIEQAGGTGTARVAAALNDTDITTFFGRTKFSTAANDHGLQVGHAMVLAQWQTDKSGVLAKQVVWPLADKSANLAYPMQREFSLVDFLWIYNLPNWASFLLIVGLTTAIGLLGLFGLRKWISRLHVEQNHNEVISYFLAAVVLFYGVMVGLIAVGIWEQFSSADEKVAEEAAALASVYRDTGAYPESIRARLQTDMREYAKYTIEGAWPLQRKGIIPAEGQGTLWNFQKDLKSFEPGNTSETVLHAETLRALNHLVELRRLRLHSVTTGLPSVVWIVVALGAALTLSVCWFFRTRNLSVHFWMVSITSTLLGSIIWLLVVLDHPFLGEVSIGPEAFEQVYSSLMMGAH